MNEIIYMIANIGTFFLKAELFMIVLLKLQLKALNKKELIISVLSLFAFSMLFYNAFLNTTTNSLIRLSFFSGFIFSLFYLLRLHAGALIKTVPLYAFITIMIYPCTYLITWFAIEYGLVRGHYEMQIMANSAGCLQLLILIAFSKTQNFMRFKQHFYRILEKYRVFFYTYLVIEAIILLAVSLDYKNQYITFLDAKRLWFSIVMGFILGLLGLLIKYLLQLSKALEKQISIQKYYALSVEDVYRDIRNYKHDIHNILLPLGYYLKSDEHQEAKRYYDHYVKTYEGFDLETFQFLMLLKPIKIAELKGLLLSRYQWSKAENIHLAIEVEHAIECLSMNILDLCHLIGSVIDQCIESIVKSINRVIKVEIRQTTDGTVITIITEKNSVIELNNTIEIIKKYKHITLEEIDDESMSHYILSFNNPLKEAIELEET